MAPKTINSHMDILRMIMTEAAERFEFDNPFRNIKTLKLQKIHIEPFSLTDVERICKYVRQGPQSANNSGQNVTLDIQTAWRQHH
jgi:integrase